MTVRERAYLQRVKVGIDLDSGDIPVPRRTQVPLKESIKVEWFHDQPLGILAVHDFRPNVQYNIFISYLGKNR